MQLGLAWLRASNADIWLVINTKPDACPLVQEWQTFEGITVRSLRDSCQNPGQA